jgi:hypothetical protein
VLEDATLGTVTSVLFGGVIKKPAILLAKKAGQLLAPLARFGSKTLPNLLGKAVKAGNKITQASNIFFKVAEKIRVPTSLANPNAATAGHLRMPMKLVDWVVGSANSVIGNTRQFLRARFFHDAHLKRYKHPLYSKKRAQQEAKFVEELHKKELKILTSPTEEAKKIMYGPMSPTYKEEYFHELIGVVERLEKDYDILLRYGGNITKEGLRKEEIEALHRLALEKMDDLSGFLSSNPTRHFNFDRNTPITTGIHSYGLRRGGKTMNYHPFNVQAAYNKAAEKFKKLAGLHHYDELSKKKGDNDNELRAIYRELAAYDYGFHNPIFKSELKQLRKEVIEEMRKKIKPIDRHIEKIYNNKKLYDSKDLFVGKSFPDKKLFYRSTGISFLKAQVPVNKKTDIIGYTQYELGRLRATPKIPDPTPADLEPMRRTWALRMFDTHNKYNDRYNKMINRDWKSVLQMNIDFQAGAAQKTSPYNKLSNEFLATKEKLKKVRVILAGEAITKEELEQYKEVLQSLRKIMKEYNTIKAEESKPITKKVLKIILGR